MARNASTIDYREDYYHGVAKIYFIAVLEELIKMGNLRQCQGVILDYGCGVGNLKKLLPGKNVVGYDIIPELTDVKDFREVRAEKIVLSGVLEHLYLPEIDTLVQELLSLNPRAELLVFLPTENIISKIGMMMTGSTNAHDDHVSKYKAINEVIERHYKLAERKYIYFRMAQLSRYVPKS